jgi:ATP-binding cassette, subfamily G (WHITE), member 2, SNQ2
MVTDLPLSVETCLRMCGLEAYGDAIVGSLGVEHRKRTTIGVELAAKPKLLLFLDEPTTGLDSQSAWGVITFLRNLAQSGTAILCTIHQPSAELFQQFDRLLLLKKGGQTVYFGPLGDRSATLIDYFQRNGARRIEEQENVAEYMLEVIGAGATATSEIEWHEKWVNSQEAQQAQQEIDRIHEVGRTRPPVQGELRFQVDPLSLTTSISNLAIGLCYFLVQSNDNSTGTKLCLLLA